MAEKSITSTDSFAIRAQRSEAIRAAIWAVLLAGLMIVTITRRAMGGVVMSEDRIFYPFVAILLLGIVIQITLIGFLRSANRAARLLPGFLWRASAIFDLCVAGGLLVISSIFSPRGAVAALSGPTLLLFPTVVMLSILRLRPRFTLRTGFAAAVVHLVLMFRALLSSHTPLESYPVQLAYGFILGLFAIAAYFVAREVKKHVVEVTNEAVAHERAERQIFTMQRDLNVAREIQRGLLPTRAPELKGFDITGMNRPADQTGGDYYDWQPLPDGRLAVVLADVSGHGIGPALVMAVCRAYARATVTTAPDPVTLITRLNDLLHGDLPADRFITFVLAILKDDGQTQLLSAGHGPTLLYRAATGQFEQFVGDGIPLGIFPAAEYGPTSTFTLDQGDILVMLTDGFFEWARPDGEPFGIPRLLDAIRANAAGDAKTILANLDHTVRNFCRGSAQSDDMTAIVVKRTAP